MQTLSREPAVLYQMLIHLDKLLPTLEPLNRFLDPPGPSVLLLELATVPNALPPDLNQSAHDMPLLQGIAARMRHCRLRCQQSGSGECFVSQVGAWRMGSKRSVESVRCVRSVNLFRK